MHRNRNNNLRYWRKKGERLDKLMSIIYVCNFFVLAEVYRLVYCKERIRPKKSYLDFVKVYYSLV